MAPALRFTHPKRLDWEAPGPSLFIYHICNMPGTGLRAWSTDPLSALTAQEEEEGAGWSAAEVA